ncbi:MAG: T9SS type A sorting domain-containing protein [Candidatus Marinimicrobia bacterium]|nr:T9SS type A sorting domain-containing protein [Candidatus Neomarinimicrobiota bacterium]
MKNFFKISIFQIISVLSIFCSNSVFSLTISKTLTDYIIENGKYIAVISKTNGMLKSLQLVGSDFEIASDYPPFSMFFPEFIYEHPDGLTAKAYYPSNDQIHVTTNVKIFDELIIVEVNWINGKIDSRWEYFFEPDKPYFRVAITREVALDGVYSNFQQCTMYTPDMDNSFIINYQGQLELTMGNYTGDKPYVAPFKEGVSYSVCTAQHSLWTVFDYGSPTYFPTIAWSSSKANIHAGIIVTYTSPNQRETISYHGGGTTGKHPGFAEAQFNWFGKSDSESLYLRKGTRFSMELYFYQNYGSIDSLLNFSENLLGRNFKYSLPENYVVASWGGRTSANELYFWRYPQVSSNYITSQELWRYKGFALPRSQNGTWDIHLFSLNLVNLYNNQRTELTPIYGTKPLFDRLWINANDTSYTGGMSWNVGDFNTKLFYTAYPAQRHITVSGQIYRKSVMTGINCVELTLSPRTQELFIDKENMLFSFIAMDVLLDTVSIGLTNITGIDTFFTKNDTLFLGLMNKSGNISSFKFDLYPITQRAFRNNSQTNEIENQPVQPYKAYFVNTTGNSGISFLPSSDYFIFNDHKTDDMFTFDLYSSYNFESLIFAIDSVQNYNVTIQSDSDFFLITQLELYDKDKYILNFPFSSKSLYHIKVKKDNSDRTSEYIKIVSVYPNPFHSVTTIRFFLNKSDWVSYEIFNIKGERILASTAKRYSRGYQELTLDLTQYASAVYFCKLSTSSSNTIVTKVTLLK